MCVCVCVITWQRLVAGQFPLQPDGLGPTVRSAPEAGRPTHTYCGAVRLDGDDGALKTYAEQEQNSSGLCAAQTLIIPAHELKNIIYNFSQWL